MAEQGWYDAGEVKPRNLSPNPRCRECRDSGVWHLAHPWGPCIVTLPGDVRRRPGSPPAAFPSRHASVRCAETTPMDVRQVGTAPAQTVDARCELQAGHAVDHEVSERSIVPIDRRRHVVDPKFFRWSRRGVAIRR